MLDYESNKYAIQYICNTSFNSLMGVTGFAMNEDVSTLLEDLE